MSSAVRLTLVSHAMTDAMAAGRFPADEPLSDIGRRQTGAVSDLDGDRARQLCGPEQRAQQTAQLLGLHPTVEPLLADLDCGHWRGRALADMGREELAAWLGDPAQAPHGGESIVDLTGRVAGWLATLSDAISPTVAVTHPAVIRAAILSALDVAPDSFWRIDVSPLSRVDMHLRQGRWTLRL